MAVTDDQYRQGMRQLAAAVSVITATHEGARNGLTATAVMSVCAEPPRLAIAVNRSASALPFLLGAGALAINVLRYDQDAVASRFAGGQHKGEARFEGSEWGTLSTGSPVLGDAAATFDCRINSMTEVGTHLLIVCDVEDIQVRPNERPLLYLDGAWASLIRANATEIGQYTETVQKSIATVDNAAALGGTPAEKLQLFVRGFTAVNIEQTGITRSFLNFEPYLPPGKLDEINQAKNEFDYKLRQLLMEGVDSGDFELDDPGLTALAITGMVGWIHRWYRHEGRYTSDEVAARLTRLVMDMVKTREPAQPLAQEA
ncbi:MAG: flavin reductase [Comamonadaceae bacterium]|nr:MAG: flavin reductase [Comamonadaceae bacterium]